MKLYLQPTAFTSPHVSVHELESKERSPQKQPLKAEVQMGNKKENKDT
jgi:hypothetical protein